MGRTSAAPTLQPSAPPEVRSLGAMPLDLSQLRSFVAVAREGNLTRAAERLCLSQPAVSAQLKALETRLELPLFTRTARGMQLTAAGRALLAEADQAVVAAQQVLTTAQQLRRGGSGALRLGTVLEPQSLRLPALLDHLGACHPQLRLSLHQGISGDIVAAIRAGRLDAGFGIEAEGDEHVAAFALAPLRLRIVAPPAWAEDLVRLDAAGLAARPWITTPVGCSFHRVVAGMLARHGVRLQAVVEADQEPMLLSLVASGLGLSLLREELALRAEQAGQVAIWPHGHETARLCFVYAKDQLHTPGLQAVLTAVRAQWGLAPAETPA